MTDKDIDILSIDNKINENFKNEKSKLVEYKKKYEQIKNSLNLANIRPRVKKSLEDSEKELKEHIENIQNDTFFNFYTAESAALLEKYKDILNAPMKMNFMGKSVKNNKEKQKLINEYLEIANKYVNIDIETPEKKEKIVCKNCQNKKDFDINECNTYICLICSVEQIVLKNVSSYRDINRINISSKYMYDRKIHFRDCINQYQGKQNSTVSQNVYDDLEEQFDKHHLLKGDKNSQKEVRFSNITKEHISIFLKELDYTKHYENINLIHYNITGKKPDDIGYIEDKLLDDFDVLTDIYDKTYKNIDRKNFINTQYVLYQLLLRHRHPCKKEDFSILKTIDRKTFHDDICKKLFCILGWNFCPYF